VDKQYEEILKQRLEKENQDYIENLCTQIPEPNSQAGPSKEPKEDSSDDDRDEDEEEEPKGKAKSVTKDKNRSPNLSGQLGLLTISGTNKEGGEGTPEKALSPQISNRGDSLFGPLTLSSEKSPIISGKTLGDLKFPITSIRYPLHKDI
jgi:hypothetical protein